MPLLDLRMSILDLTAAGPSDRLTSAFYFLGKGTCDFVCKYEIR